MTEERLKTGDMWTPYKELQSLVEKYVTSASNVQDPQYHEFFETLRNHRQNFLNLLTNPHKNAVSREEIKQGSTKGITSPGVGQMYLSKDLIDEIIIISDMYDLNEYMAMNLLYTAQMQMPYHPGLTRGLTAVLLYYDGRRALTSALKSLVQARSGHSWMLDIPLNLTKQITEYTNKMEQDGLLHTVLSVLEDMDPVKEQELLQQNRAIGGAKHHFMVMKLYNDIRQDLADILYMWSAQTSLPKAVTFDLLTYLQTRQPEAELNDPTQSKITLSLVMAMLNTLNLSPLYNREDGEEIVRTMSLVSEPDMLDNMIQKLMSGQIDWESGGLRGLLQFALAIAVTTIRSANNLNSSQIMAKEDEILEKSLSNKALHFCVDVVLKNKNIYHEEFYLRYFHTLISDFILLMPLKVKELRSRADESMRLIQAYQQEGIEPPMNLDDHFEYLLLMVAELYKEDPLNLNLAMDYWCLHSESSTHVQSHGNRLPSRQVALFKFVRLAGEILPAGLFVPYLKMIASLASSAQAARQAFNFLKPNGSSGSTTISWDHFFNSLNRYYSNLRQELPPSHDTVYRQRTHPKGITPNEVKGLEAVLTVVQVVAKYDEMSRAALCEHPSWRVLPVLVGLVSCAMPIPLKGVLVRTLASLAKSSTSCFSVWQSLETAQILTTIPSTSNYQPRGVQTELEEIESRNEEYPLTRAMLELLDCLTDFPIPRLLGVGQRNPGLDPYLNFIVNTVFLRFHTRSYKIPAEKWEVAHLCLRIFQKLIHQYQPCIDDFVGCKVELQGGGSTLMNAAPGYHLMTQLHTKSELLHVILRILYEGCELFDTYENFAGKKHLEHCTLYCLKILEQSLKLQHEYMTLLNTANLSNKILAGISRLLLGVNPRTGKPDHMINVAKYISYNSWLRQHAYLAVGIIQKVSNEPAADSELLSTFTSTPQFSTSIRHGFVECLDMDESEGDNERDEIEDKNRVLECKERILLLMMQSITRPSPNLAHYLLGFDITKDTRKTVIQQPGILGFPRTCLHSILGILEQSLERGRDTITQACYWFLYILSANVRTSTPILRFLRTATNQDFVQRHLSKLPFQGSQRATDLTCMSWLLKIAAIELRVGGGSLQNSLIQRLVGSCMPDRDQGSFSQKLLMDLLHYIDFQLEIEPAKSWEFFDPQQIQMVFGKCSAPSLLTGGPQLVDVQKLNSLLSDELAVTQSTATAAQRKLMEQEVQLILSYAHKRNENKTLAYATVKFVEGWCQTTEILFSIATSQQLPTAYRQNLLLNLSHDLLQKMTSCDALAEIKNLVSGTVLILLVNLRNSFVLQEGEDLSPAWPANTTMMKIILNHILQWIINSEASSQKVRTHLYGAFLNFLCVVSVDRADTQMSMDTLYVSQLDNSMYRALPMQEKSHRYATIQVVNAFGDKFMDIICHNCSGGHDVCKMLALSCLDKILELDCDNAWVIYLSSRGYLKHMIDSLLDSDGPLRFMVQLDPQNLKPLYLYEAKMATFCRMASTRLGAESLLENNLLSCLSSMTVFDNHPDIHVDFDSGEGFLPSIGERYQQILLPALYLCDALLTTLGTENQSCCVQVCGFLQSHREVVETALRNAMPSSNPLFLKEVACITGVVARSANIDMYTLLDEQLGKVNEHMLEDSTGMRELRGHLYSLQKLLLSLLSKFHMKQPFAVSHNLKRNDHDQYSYGIQICANIMLYARNQMQHSRMDQKIKNVLFEPRLTQTSENSDRMRETISSTPLGVVLDHLQTATTLIRSELPSIDLLIQKSVTVKDMGSAELKEHLLDEELELETGKQRMVVEQRLAKQVKEKRENVKYCSLIVEHSLYILWSHLDFYMIQAAARHNSSHSLDASMMDWRIPNESISELKNGLVQAFTDNFITQLLETSAEHTTVDRNFIEALIRRIKRLLQFIIVKK